MAFPDPASFTPSAETSNVTTHTVDMPSTVDDGDLLVLAIISGSTSLAPSGTDLDDWDLAWSGTLVSTADWYVYVKDADGTEDGGSVDFTTSGSAKSSAQVVRITGGRHGGEGTGWDITADGSHSFGTAPDSPSDSPTWGSDDNLWLTLFFAGGTGGTVTANPTNYTAGDDNDSSSGWWLGTAWRKVAASSENPGAFTIDDGGPGENWISATMSFRPAVAVVSGDGSADMAMTASGSGPSVGIGSATMAMSGSGSGPSVGRGSASMAMTATAGAGPVLGDGSTTMAMEASGSGRAAIGPIGGSLKVQVGGGPRLSGVQGGIAVPLNRRPRRQQSTLERILKAVFG